MSSMLQWVLPSLNELLVVGGMYVAIGVLHLVLPATCVDGYVVNTTTNRPLVYRLNGLRVWAVVVGFMALLV
jgi:hypothetical protein